jgi:hypothetical protein
MNANRDYQIDHSINWTACTDCYPDPKWVEHMILVDRFQDHGTSKEDCVFCGVKSSASMEE